MGIQYRPEIDGLRAIAVLAVVAFHAGIGGAGYVGVDVFFVISGYLITSLLLQEHASTGSIDLLAFYARRVRRIFPAAAVVVVATLCASWVLLDPLAQAQAAKSAGAALVFGANVFFQLTTGGYWDGASEEMPLLHLWSLSVEEQFYLLWPALLIFTRSRRTMLALTLLSFGLAEFWIARGSDAAFFQMPARFWELAIGGLIAASPARALPRLLGPVGVVVTLAACVFPVGHFPGYGALPAVLGACAVIAAVHGGARIALLASRPMVGVGLVSYSLYLWHWPLLALYRAKGGDDLAIRIGLCVVAVPMALLSYRFIEQPLRRMRFPSGQTVATGAALSGLLALSACAIGLRDVPPPAIMDHSREALAYRVEHDRISIACEYNPSDKLPKCPDPVGAKVAIWGDSMALAWRAGLPTDTLQYTMHGCPPVVGFETKQGGCAAFNASVPARILGVDTVYLAANWREYQAADMTRTFAVLRDVPRVVVIGPSPKLRYAVGRCLRNALPCSIPRARFDAESRPILARLREQAKTFPNVEVQDVSAQFCTSAECPAFRGDVALYWDTHHISMTQARRVMTQTDTRTSLRSALTPAADRSPAANVSDPRPR